MGTDTKAGHAGEGQGGTIPAPLAARLDHLDATAGEILAVARAILAVVAAEPDDGRPRLDELLGEIVALQRDTLRLVGEHAATLRQISEALARQEGGAGPNGAAPHGPTTARRGGH